MTAGIEGDPGRAMAGSMAAFPVTIACLTDQEWEKAGPALKHGNRNGRTRWDAVPLGPTGRTGRDGKGNDSGGGGRLHRLGPSGAGLRPGHGAGTRPGARHSSTGAHTGDNRAHTGLYARDNQGQPDRDACDTHSVADQNACAGHTNAGPNTGDHPVITVAAILAELPEYDRSDWKHWTDADGDCQDARQEVLVTESLVPVTFETDRKCRVATGRWWAPHLGHHLENPSQIDVDHHVPLKNAHLSGGWAWTPEEKERYANYLGEENHLVAISSRHNRSKGARGPEEWEPPDNTLWCDYAVDWAQIKVQWELTMTPVEAEIVMDMLGTCENPPEYEVEIRRTMEVRVGGGISLRLQSRMARCTGPAMKRRPRGNRGCREARAEDGDSLRRWSRALGTGTETV